jgi:hypothetical protein
VIDQQQRRNPLRWALLVLLVGIVVSLIEPIPQLKFQAQRLVELLVAVGLLAWSYRPQPASALAEQPLAGWYGLGLLGLTASALLSGAAGPIPWISLGFVGLVLLQFSLLPLLRQAWQHHTGDTMRLLALFSLALLGIDVGLWLLDHLHGIAPYVWIQRLGPDGQIASAPYLFLNSRWANQLTVLLIWTFIPLLDQLQGGVIRQRRWFWWVVAIGVPWLGMAQVVLSQGDGAFVAISLGTATLAVLGLQGGRAQRRLCWWSVALLFSGALLAASLSAGLDGSQFFGLLLDRNAAEFTPAAPTTDKRLVLWSAYASSVLAHPWLGRGIAAIPPGSPACTPHNLWLALLQGVGLIGSAAAVSLATAFVPRRLQHLRPMAPFALPLLAALFNYQLVDDLWLRPLSLAVLLLVLPGLLVDHAQQRHRLEPLCLRAWALPITTWRVLALVGLLLITISAVHPAGVGFAPSHLVQASARGGCLLLF